MTSKPLAISVKSISRSSVESAERTCHLCVDNVDDGDSIVMGCEDYCFRRILSNLLECQWRSSRNCWTALLKFLSGLGRVLCFFFSLCFGPGSTPIFELWLTTHGRQTSSWGMIPEICRTLLSEYSFSFFFFFPKHLRICDISKGRYHLRFLKNS